MSFTNLVDRLRDRLPLVGVAVAVALMAVVVPSVSENTGDNAATGAITDVGGITIEKPADEAGLSPVDNAAEGATETGGSNPSPAGGSAPSAGGNAAPPPGTNLPAAAGTVSLCADRTLQVPGDTYSPPCIAFAGTNAGANSQGVTDTEIVVAARVLNEPGFQQALAAVAGAEIDDTPEDFKRTAVALVEYFNTRFQFYGRQIKLVFFDGKGSSTNEVLGGGQEEAEADAIHVDEKIGAFAEVNAGTPPYTDALSRRGIVAFNAPYMSREWYTSRRPYAWSLTTDCSIIVETVAEYIHKRMMDGTAIHARGSIEGAPRKFVALAPENPWYQECVDAGEAILKSYGRPPTSRLAYKLDLGSMSNQASNIIARLKSDSITSILCGCDPVFPIFLTSKASEQNYHPEWVVTGTALTDLDLIGQLYDQDQWSRAFGVSYLGSPQPLRASYGYQAYKAVRDDEPAFAVDLVYYALYMLAIGIQGAGPELTPATFEQGMFEYPGGTGPLGTWGFGPQNYTPTEDAREIWWDPERTSKQNNERGAYVESEPGVRYRTGQWPTGEPRVFQ